MKHKERPTSYFSFPVRSKSLTSYCDAFANFASVTAYTLYDDALKTGELDYINGGTSAKRIFFYLSLLISLLNHFQLPYIIFFLSCTRSISDIRKFPGITSSDCTSKNLVAVFLLLHIDNILHLLSVKWRGRTLITHRYESTMLVNINVL